MKLSPPGFVTCSVHQYTSSVQLWTVSSDSLQATTQTTGNNIRLVKEASGLSVWSSTTQQVWKAIKEKEMVAVLPEDSWRVPYLRKLLEQRLQHHYRAEKDNKDRVQLLIYSLCVNLPN